VRQRQFKLPAKNTEKREKAEDEQLEQSQSETERYLLQIDKQSKRSFKTPEAAWTAALDINPVFPLCRFPFTTSLSGRDAGVTAPSLCRF
jgi:hypothetical protein